MVALLPMLLAVYLFQFQSQTYVFEDHLFHELAIFVAIAQSSFIAFVTWRCYVSSGEPLLRWFSLAFIGFAIIYAPHGIFTSQANLHVWLFLLYGPASRFVMALLLFVGVVSYGRTSHPLDQRTRLGNWLPWLLLFLLVDLLIAAVALQWPESELMANICSAGGDGLERPDIAFPTQFFRLITESGAVGVSLVGAALILTRRPLPPLMLLSAIALAYSAQSSLVFLFAKVWEHTWWLAHLIGAAGFTLLSYGVVRAYHTTRAFSLVFSQEEVIRQLSEAKANAESLAAQLEQANQYLNVLAATDPLTGLSNRRHFQANAEIEVARARRNQTSFAMLAIDLDHFKSINDNYGHAGGDAVLKGFAELAKMQLRPTDLIGRIGGEEFLILLPGLEKDMGFEVAERIRLEVQAKKVGFGQGEISVTISIGISQFPEDGDTLELVCHAADERLYRAKNTGRNRSVRGDC